MIASNFHRLRRMGFGAGKALVCAYRYYRSVYQTPNRISFDRAFDLAAHTDGLWIASQPSFALAECTSCGSEFLDSLGPAAAGSSTCPFCRLLQRAERDPRVRDSFPRPPPIDMDVATRFGPLACTEADGNSPFDSARLDSDTADP